MSTTDKKATKAKPAKKVVAVKEVSPVKKAKAVKAVVKTAAKTPRKAVKKVSVKTKSAVSKKDTGPKVLSRLSVPKIIALSKIPAESVNLLYTQAVFPKITKITGVDETILRACLGIKVSKPAGVLSVKQTQRLGQLMATLTQLQAKVGKAGAKEWLSSKAEEFAGKTGLSLLRTEIGFDKVSEAVSKLKTSAALKSKAKKVAAPKVVVKPVVKSVSKLVAKPAKPAQKKAVIKVPAKPVAKIAKKAIKKA